jgi:hypothetical protein
MTQPGCVPYENFVRLQLVLGEDPASIASISKKVGVPPASMEKIAGIQNELLSGLPAALRATTKPSDLSREFAEKHADALSLSSWDGLNYMLQYSTRQAEFSAAMEHFCNPELRLRVDCLIVSRQCSPAEISAMLRRWSKYEFTPQAVETYSYFFCNMDRMHGFSAWQSYIESFKDESRRWCMAQAFDTQTKCDLSVLAHDIGMRGAVELSSEESARELLSSAFVNIKREERRINRGVPAKNTSIFEWSGVYCSMFDRVHKLLDSGDRENAVERIQVTLTKLKNADIKKISDYKMSSGVLPEQA